MKPASPPPPPDLKRDFLKVLLLPVLWLLLIPAVALVFTKYGEAKVDREVLASITKQIGEDAQLPDEAKARELEVFRKMPPTRACDATEPRFQRYRESICSRGSMLWQFVQADRMSETALALGILAIVFVLATGFAAFNRRAQYWSFMLGWRGLTAVSVVELVIQAGLLVWLSFWMTALLMNVYSVKLILIVSALAAVSLWVGIKAILQKAPEPELLEAEVVDDHVAPRLWGRLRDLAARIGTEPPRHVVAGIDDNFFVTETGLRLSSGQLDGRALYMSIPLLRILETSEADAIFAHELAHFLGGDTAASARLGPKLVKYDLYMEAMAQGGLTRPTYYLLRLFRAIFEYAFKKEKRERELMADRRAASVTSAENFGRALLKVSAYSSFRQETERALFLQKVKLTNELHIKERIQGGLAAHVASANFMESVKHASVPHPFDTHPHMSERFDNLQAKVNVSDVVGQMGTLAASSWADEVTTAEAIENRLWKTYEQRFQKNHEQSLVFRYLPSSAEERAIVERSYPPRSFEMKGGGQVTLTYAGVEIPGYEKVLLPFRELRTVSVQSGSFSSKMTLKHAPTATEKAQTATLNLRKLGKQEAAFKQAFSHYWNRDQAARAWAAHTPE